MEHLVTKFRKSKNRDMILEFITNSKSHPTADMVYISLKKKIPSLSVGNVYRNLNILIEQNFIRKVEVKEQQERFEAICEPHYHFICEGCGAILDLEMPIQNDLNKKLQKISNLKVNRHQLTFFGCCDSCNC
jgi:Fe2+ or Zn2+ uptake regulation protein